MLRKVLVQLSKGEKSCALSRIGATSVFPSKPLGVNGDAGAIFTNSDELALYMKQICIHGQNRRYHHTKIGVNGRLDTIQVNNREQLNKPIYKARNSYGYSLLCTIE